MNTSSSKSGDSSGVRAPVVVGVAASARPSKRVRATDQGAAEPTILKPLTSSTHAAGGAGAGAGDAFTDTAETRLLVAMGLRGDAVTKALPLLTEFVGQATTTAIADTNAAMERMRAEAAAAAQAADAKERTVAVAIEAAAAKERAAATAAALARARMARANARYTQGVVMTQDANARLGILADMDTHELRARELGRRLEMVREMTAAIHDLSAYMIRNRRFDPRFQVALQDAAKNVIIDGTASLDHRYGLSISCEALLIQIALTLDELKLVGELMDKFHHSPHPQHLKYIGGGTYMVNTYFIEDRDNMRAMIRDVDATRGQPRHIVFARAAARLGHAGA